MTATMGYQSNYLGQMETVTYPDGETVDYGYDAGGQVKSVTGHHYTHDYLFVVDIGYDEFGQRIYIKYGNGVKTDYFYDENRRWLSSIETGMDGHQYQNIQYSFDAVGNVLGYSNDCMNGLRYSTSQNYTYDSLYQLTSAHGDTYYDPYPGGLPDVKTAYDQNFEFDVLGNMTCKLSKEKADYKKHVTGDDLNYTLNYSYAQGFAHRLDHVSDIYYKYDLNGNITMMHKGPIPDYDSSNSGETPSDPSSDDDFWDDDWENGGTGGLIPGNGSGQSGNVGEQGASGSDDDFWDDDWENGGTSGLIPGNPDSGTGNNDDDFWDDDWENGGTSGLISGMKVVQFATESSSDDNFWDDWNENSESSSSWNGNTDSSSNSSGSAEASDDDFWDDDWENGGTSGHSDFGWGLGGGSGNKNPDSAIAGEYRWDERDRLIESFVGDKNASYVYGEDGQRSNKWTIYEETLYFNRMWTWHDGNANNDQTAKHIYLGSERIVSQMNSWKGQQTYSEEHHKTYYYHSDHLGSAQLITDYKGNEYQRIEYTPYGEEWIDKFQNENYVDMPYKFTGKERDEETGFYYYGARYLDPKFSIWMSTDPALGEYIPQAPVSDEAKKHNQNLPGMGGVFNAVNLNLYHYAGNNPIKYTDPDGESLLAIAAVGFCIGAAIETTSQLYDIYKKTGSLDVTQLDGRKIAIQGLSGMASSLLCVTGAGLAIQVAGNAMINTVADLADQLTDNKKGVDGWEVLSSGISGAIGGLVGGKGNKEIGSQLTRMEKRILGALKKGDFSEIGKAVAYFQKNTGTLAKQFNKEALKDALKNYLPDKIRDNVIDEIINYVKKKSED